MVFLLAVGLLVLPERFTVMRQQHDIRAQAVHAILALGILCGIVHDGVPLPVPVIVQPAGIASD